MGESPVYLLSNFICYVNMFYLLLLLCSTIAEQTRHFNQERRIESIGLTDKMTAAKKGIILKSESKKRIGLQRLWRNRIGLNEKYECPQAGLSFQEKNIAVTTKSK